MNLTTGERPLMKVLSVFWAKEILIYGVLIRVRMHRATGLVFAYIESGRVRHKVNIPARSGCIEKALRLKGKPVQAVIECVKMAGVKRKRLLSIKKDS